MSSWIIKNNASKKKTIKPVTMYHDTSNSRSLSAIYMDLLAAYIHSQKNGNYCNLWDPNGLIKLSFKYNPQIIHLKELPETNTLSFSDYKTTVDQLKFSDIKKYASKLIDYNSDFNNSISQAFNKASINSKFDLAIHLPFDNSAQEYINLIKEYQIKSKKVSLSIYVMATSYDMVKDLIKLGDSSWNIVSMSKNPLKDGENFFSMMAEVKLMSTIPSLILDFTQDIDRYIYMVHENIRDLHYFKEINDTQWFLI